ncbi:SAM-dependent methyltransferase [Pseudonocardia acaciae]|uniref:SAM-dependent methyltransferase n=1 Tax=Pseudonocardia acaciae TaxID=551276 RepID=UPI000490E80B|nr:SAM-dependent methyltransferase [Pseudonocardia acaciae]
MGQAPLPEAALPEAYFRTPSPARFWNYLQGGRDNYPLDRVAADAFATAFPDIFMLADQARRFLMRAVRAVAAEGGVRQFLDVGCGLPVPRDLADIHEVAQRVRPDARVVYVDNDKVVRAHTQAWLRSSTPEGACSYVEADAREPERILAEAGRTLDLSEPVAVVLSGILGHITDFDEARSVLDHLMNRIVPGSYLVLHDGVDKDRAVRQGIDNRNATGIQPYHLRTEEQFRAYFRGLEVLEPGIGLAARWRPEKVEVGVLRPVITCWGAVARKT